MVGGGGMREIRKAFAFQPGAASLPVIQRSSITHTYMTSQAQAIHPILGKQMAIHTHTTLITPCPPQAPGLPKTRSGKIMRRVLRKIASKEEEQLGDTSTLADPNVVNVLVSLRGK